ncbi:c-type cytochrome [Schauerella aestuarii]|uniref:c-type cytochrome n=1 Tax=Schauerella aestuarii TaxID=2511204 RepID=UPI001370AE53|nr:c-type cytochrome [Achromobacter aestuarii]MYZ44180.1 cytochrome c5 family protein [Achromobacter aestuarii]
MSNAQDHSEEHSSPIKTPKQLVVTIVLSFVIPVIVLILLANMVTFGSKGGSGSDAATPESISKRVAPVAGFEFVDATAPKVFKTGEQVFQAVCTACHTAGVAGAPKVGDNAAWAPLIASGLDEMTKIAIAGKGGMPAKGGNPSLSDYEVARAVVFMANKSGGDLKEPAAPEQPAAGGQAAAAPAAPAAASAAAPAAGAAAPAAAPAPAAPQQAQAQSAAGAAPAAAAPTQTAAVNPAGEKLYKSACMACHAAGIAGAPKFGDKAAWAPYIATGIDTMVQVALKGKGAMPPKGGAMNASEADIRAAVEYMASAAK